VTYYLINTFTAKSLLGKGKQGEDLFGYRDFAQFKFYQTYDINAAQSGTTTTTTTAARPFSDIYAEMELAPWPYLTLRSTLGWSPYTNQMDSQDYTLTFLDKKGSRAYVEYLATSVDQFRQVNANLSWQINPIWSANFQTNYSLDQNKNYGTNIGVSYKQQCWGIKLSYSSTPTDQSFTISFSLTGLGEF
jgi:LPS-assembly protein